MSSRSSSRSRPLPTAAGPFDDFEGVVGRDLAVDGGITGVLACPATPRAALTAANQYTLARLGLHLDDAELRAITAALDVDGDGSIGRAEFFARMKHIGRMRRKQSANGGRNPTYKPPPSAQRIQLSGSHPSLGAPVQAVRQQSRPGSSGFRFRTMAGGFDRRSLGTSSAITGFGGHMRGSTYELPLPEGGDLLPPRPHRHDGVGAAGALGGRQALLRRWWVVVGVGAVGRAVPAEAVAEHGRCAPAGVEAVGVYCERIDGGLHHIVELCTKCWAPRVSTALQLFSPAAPSCYVKRLNVCSAPLHTTSCSI
jgi:hypothetical protein